MIFFGCFETKTFHNLAITFPMTLNLFRKKVLRRTECKCGKGNRIVTLSAPLEREKEKEQMSIHVNVGGKEGREGGSERYKKRERELERKREREANKPFPSLE